VPFMPWGVDGKSTRRSNKAKIFLPTKSRGRLLCQGQGNEPVVNRRQIVAASGGRKTREDVASHDQPSFIVEWVKFLRGIDRLETGQYEDDIPDCGKKKYLLSHSGATRKPRKVS
jgi:hypothetical protein